MKNLFMKKTILFTLTVLSVFSLLSASCHLVLDIKDNIAICGNGIVEAGEECDSANLNDFSCNTLFNAGGTLKCTPTCKLDISECEGEHVCGNGIIEPGEECDGTNLNSLKCKDLGYGAGTLRCSRFCMLDTSECGASGICGNGIVEPGEECDNPEQKQLDCKDIGFPDSDATYSCNSSCKIDTGNCGYCGDGILTTDEICDGEYFQPDACRSVGYWYGTPGECVYECIPSPEGCHYAYQWGTTNTDSTYGITLDSAGNPYIVGFSYGDIINNVNDGEGGPFLTKFNINADQVWTTQWLFNQNYSNDYTRMQDVIIDADGYIYVTGSTNTALDNNENLGSIDIFLTKFTPDGVKLWTKLWGTEEADSAISITSDSIGNLYILGYTYGSVDGEAYGEDSDIIIIKTTADGTTLWTKQWGTSDDDYVREIKIYDKNTIYIAGYTYGSFDNMTNHGNRDLFIIKMTSEGNIVWITEYGSSDVDEIHGMDVSFDENIYVTGFTRGDLEGNINLGFSDIFLTKLNSQGQIIWTMQWGNETSNQGAKVAVSNDNYIYISGYAGGDLDENTNYGGSDIFLSKFDESGEKLWTKSWGTTKDDTVSDMVMDNNNIYITGYTYGGLDGFPEPEEVPDIYILRAAP